MQHCLTIVFVRKRSPFRHCISLAATIKLSKMMFHSSLPNNSFIIQRLLSILKVTAFRPTVRFVPNMSNFFSSFVPEKRHKTTQIHHSFSSFLLSFFFFFFCFGAKQKCLFSRSIFSISQKEKAIFHLLNNILFTSRYMDSMIGVLCTEEEKKSGT